MTRISILDKLYVQHFSVLFANDSNLELKLSWKSVILMELSLLMLETRSPLEICAKRNFGSWGQVDVWS